MIGTGSSDGKTDPRSPEAAPLWVGLIGLAAVVVAVATARRLRLRRRGARLAATEARMAPTPVVY